MAETKSHELLMVEAALVNLRVAGQALEQAQDHLAMMPGAVWTGRLAQMIPGLDAATRAALTETDTARVLARGVVAILGQQAQAEAIPETTKT